MDPIEKIVSDNHNKFVEQYRVEEKKKREIKNKAKRFKKVKKFAVVGLASLMLASGIAVANEANTQKENMAKEALDTVKTSLSQMSGVDKDKIEIWDNSSLTSSNSAKTEYKVTVGDETYIYSANIQDGIKENEKGTMTPKVAEIISNAIGAQDGFYFKVYKANNNVKKAIEEGKGLCEDSQGRLSTKKEKVAVKDLETNEEIYK